MKSERMQTYLQRQKKRGLVNVSVWVPKKRVAEIRAIADQFRRKHGVITKRSQSLYGGKDD